MPQFFATTPRGLEKVLEEELHDLGIHKTKIGTAGVYFESNWAGCYKANLHLVSASRVLYPVLDFPAYEPDQIYHNVLKHDFTKYITPDQTIAMDSKVRDSVIRDLRIVALKTKDAVVDQFRNKYDVRPDVNTEDPDLQVSIRLVKNMCTVALDTSGGTLHQRGYRDPRAPAPLKENLAAALVKMSRWDKKSPLLDPFCGSGTLLIEGAMMAMGIPPSSLRHRFGFQRWLTFQKDAYKTVREEAAANIIEDLPFKLYGSDRDGKIIEHAKGNAEEIGVGHVITFEKVDVANLQPRTDVGTIVTNPPYGERLGADDNLMDLYRQFGNVMKERYKGWRIFMITNQHDLAKSTGLRIHHSERVYNGSIECRFYEFTTP